MPDGEHREHRLHAGRTQREEADPRTIARACKHPALLRPAVFYAEPYTGRPGVTVSVDDALHGCREILDGDHDDIPEHACYLTGGIHEVRSARR